MTTILSRSDLNTLMTPSEGAHISIFMPTYRVGRETRQCDGNAWLLTIPIVPIGSNSRMPRPAASAANPTPIIKYWYCLTYRSF